ncbi:hypothetical protein DWF04_018220 [Cereibacter sphaeroides f. sp. denitrificans]
MRLRMKALEDHWRLELPLGSDNAKTGKHRIEAIISEYRHFDFSKALSALMRLLRLHDVGNMLTIKRVYFRDRFPDGEERSYDRPGARAEYQIKGLIDRPGQHCLYFAEYAERVEPLRAASIETKDPAKLLFFWYYLRLETL